MINLEEIARKIDKILNGVDLEIPSGIVSPANDNYFFRVFSEGLYLSDIYDKNASKNFMPVIVGAYGGENNPVAGLGEQDRNVMVQILFPVRFKQDMYALEEYLDEVFVGKELTFGLQKAICNLSPAQFGELQDFDFNEFNQWVETTYQVPIEKMETYMSMSFNIYLSTAKKVGVAGGFIYGNEGTATLKIDNIDQAYITSKNWTWQTGDDTDELIFVEQSLQSSSDPAVQQLMGTNEIEGLPTGTSYGTSFSVYVKNSNFYRYLLSQWFDGNIQELTLTLTFNIMGLEFTRTCFIQSINLNAKKGELVTITFTFTKKVVIDNGL